MRFGKRNWKLQVRNKQTIQRWILLRWLRRMLGGARRGKESGVEERGAVKREVASRTYCKQHRRREVPGNEE
ncbi:hypothetical protein V5799_008940 [Amblyomma americanum]|uniref:Uncharacterized protein n=1 Tax=Amblyomma americanum TaxID=6943 RepID=A0AAQ4FDD0_AMBAM